MYYKNKEWVLCVCQHHLHTLCKFLVFFSGCYVFVILWCSNRVHAVFIVPVLRDILARRISDRLIVECVFVLSQGIKWRELDTVSFWNAPVGFKSIPFVEPQRTVISTSSSRSLVDDVVRRHLLFVLDLLAKFFDLLYQMLCSCPLKFCWKYSYWKWSLFWPLVCTTCLVCCLWLRNIFPDPFANSVY